MPVELEEAPRLLLALAVLVTGDADAEQPVDHDHRAARPGAEREAVDAEAVDVEDEQHDPGEDQDPADPQRTNSVNALTGSSSEVGNIPAVTLPTEP